MEKALETLKQMYLKNPLRFILCLLAFFLFLTVGLALGGYYSGEAVAKRTYDKKSAENLKIIQKALAEAKKFQAEANEHREAADRLSALNQERADVQTKKDKELDVKIQVTDKIRREESEKIEEQHNSELQRVDTMSDSERQSDICAKLTDLAKRNPDYANYQCK